MCKLPVTTKERVIASLMTADEWADCISYSWCYLTSVRARICASLEYSVTNNRVIPGYISGIVAGNASSDAPLCKGRFMWLVVWLAGLIRLSVRPKRKDCGPLPIGGRQGL